MAEDQHKRLSQSPSGDSSKKTMLSAPSCPPSSAGVKEEPQEGDAAHGGGGSRVGAAVAEQATPAVNRPRIDISVEAWLLHCAVAECNRPLKPPTFKVMSRPPIWTQEICLIWGFAAMALTMEGAKIDAFSPWLRVSSCFWLQCEAGHLLCGACRGDRCDEGHCRRCGGRATAFAHCGPELDLYVGDARVPCPFKEYGCGVSVVYHATAAHQDTCAYAPCHCSVPGCPFTASPPRLRDHLAFDHSWRLDRLPGYGKPLPLRVPAAAEPHRLLVVEGDERRLFALSVRPRGAASFAVSVSCVRTNAAAEAGPRFTCTLWAQAQAQAQAAPGVPAGGGTGRRLMMETDVGSCAVPGGTAVEEGMALYVPPPMLRGPAKEMHLRYCTVCLPAGWRLTMEAGEGGPTSELLLAPPPPPPLPVKRNGKKRARDGPLLFGAQLIKHEAKEKDEEPVEATPQGAEAIVPSESPEKRPAATAVQVDKAKLYCSLCACALTPPIYQCPVGHLACCSCRVKLPGRRCRTCRDRGTASSAYAHCPGLDLFFGDLRVPCDFEDYGCSAYVPYFLSAGHKDACEHASCHCPEPGCSLLCSPRTLAAHLAGDHYWAVYDVAYGTPLPLAIPVPAAAAASASASPPPPPAPARDLRLLRGDDASLFLMAVGPLGEGAAVSVVLVRATASPPALPRFTCTFYANPPPGAAYLEGGYFFATVPVRSSALADGAGAAPEKELYFAVPREMLCGGSRELLLSVRIDRSSGPEPPVERQEDDH
ncbi:hypothetical protein BAE44_0018071 [Dichanthelium oligosanthes]|uniref:SIAH-type domain-containing protein n=1 Tax=Dichanthelium oligosanthes TaxID=888268 RepID=A0A1E5V6W8_9POAL|nr:hypothetical protein BAE44_0018071 [Dichanthelium oligosanthes]